MNADDFGLTSGVNRAILRLNQLGRLSSATLMAVAEATTEAGSIAQNAPNLGVGCHIVLVDGMPALRVEQLPTLVNQATGRFRSTLGQFVKDLFLGRIRESEIQAEAEAQIARICALGLTPTHIDTHKHTHMFPQVLQPMLQAARHKGIPSIRNPFEPIWSLNATPGAPLIRQLQVQVLNRFRPSFHRMVDKSGLLTTNGAIGVLATGTLDARTLNALLGALPNGTWELVTHPGYYDADLGNARTRLLASRETELEALANLPLAADAELIHFGQLAATSRRPT